MADIVLPLDSAVVVPVNKVPFVSDTDFKTVVTLAYDAPGMALQWNFVSDAGATSATVVTPTTGGVYDWTDLGGGMAKIEIPASAGASINNNVSGHGWFSGKATGVLPWTGPIIQFAAASGDAWAKDLISGNYTEGTAGDFLRHAVDRATNTGLLGVYYWGAAAPTMTYSALVSSAASIMLIADNTGETGGTWELIGTYENNTFTVAPAWDGGNAARLLVTVSGGASGIVGGTVNIWVTIVGVPSTLTFNLPTVAAGTTRSFFIGNDRNAFYAWSSPRGTIYSRGWTQQNPALIDANVVQIDGNPTNNNTASLKLKQLECVNTDGDAIVATGYENGLSCTAGSSFGVGIKTTGPYAGMGVISTGTGANQGNALVLTPTAGNAGLKATKITGDMTGNITGSLTGDVVGSVTGDVKGKVLGTGASSIVSIGAFVQGDGTGSVTLPQIEAALSSVPVTLKAATHTGAVIPRVTDLTNAPTNGDLTAVMKASVAAAVPTAAAVQNAAVAAIQSTPVTLAAGTHTGAVIPTVTNLTNAPTNGDLTSVMKASVTAAVPEASGMQAAVTAALNSTPVVLAAQTHTGAIIPTVTNLTNAPTAGDLTATMKASVTAAVPAHADIQQAAVDAIIEAGIVPLEGVLTQTQVQAATAAAITAANLAVTGAEMALTPGAITAIWAYVVEGTVTASQSFRALLSYLIAKCRGGNSSPVVFRDIGDTKDRVSMTVDANGNRSDVTVDLT